MKITKPGYYDTFRCIASRCPDSCCREWDVDVDEQAAARYRSLPGPLGDRLRQVLRTEDGGTVMTIENGRCPMWREDGLCRIQAELGEEALCHVCREFPRLRHDYGDFAELGLELSCPEAARLILNTDSVFTVTETVPGGEAPDYDTDAMKVLLSSREIAREILADRRYSAGEVLAQLLIYGYDVQEVLDGGENAPFDPEAALQTARQAARDGDPDGFLAFFRGLELLTAQWEQLLANPRCGCLTDAHRALARYMVDRYWLQAVSDWDLVCRVKFAILACLLTAIVGGELTGTAQLFSKEIENDADNVDAILDGAYTTPAFTDDKLLGMLLGK